MEFLAGSLLELITQTSVNLPPDVRAAMGVTISAETPNTQSAQALSIIATNIDMAVEDQGPICQDTGMPTFLVHTPVGVNQIELKKAIHRAVVEATRLGKLRPNSVDSITGKNSGDNLGHETPVIHFEQWDKDDIEVKLLLKGGGCENKNIQYSLPTNLDHMGNAGRDLEGVRKCLLHAVWQAQGQGCAPGAIGVCIGSDRAHGYWLAKEQLFRALDDTNPDPVLAKLEAEVMEEANRISIGAMGFGGKASLIGCKVVAANRLPASFFVSVAYMCWAYRRRGVVLDIEGEHVVPDRVVASVVLVEARALAPIHHIAFEQDSRASLVRVETPATVVVAGDVVDEVVPDDRSLLDAKGVHAAHVTEAPLPDMMKVIELDDVLLARRLLVTPVPTHRNGRVEQVVDLVVGDEVLPGLEDDDACLLYTSPSPRD